MYYQKSPLGHLWTNVEGLEVKCLKSNFSILCIGLRGTAFFEMNFLQDQQEKVLCIKALEIAFFSFYAFLSVGITKK